MIDLLQERLKSYGVATVLEEENATKEILQEVALYALWRAGFFEVGLFHGGTSLRILHGLPRFSEDLDFMLKAPSPAFDWAPYLAQLLAIFEDFGLRSEAVPKGDLGRNIRAAVIKDTSIAQQLDLSFGTRNPNKTIKIKLEIDVNPPAHSGEAMTFLDFPLDHQVRHQDLGSNFALKIHALLCRGFLKGRDWYDFSWYVAKGVTPNLPHLQAALEQYGPWSENEDLSVSRDWLQTTLGHNVTQVNWKKAADDVRRFLRSREAASLDLWNADFFSAKLDKLMKTLSA